MVESASLPRWLGPANRVIIALQHRGLVIGTMRLLSVPGRKSGQMRTTPVSPLTVEGKRYIVGGLESSDWVKNARTAGWGILARGRNEEKVVLVELPVEERASILREFPQRVPHGVQFFRGTSKSLPRWPRIVPCSWSRRREADVKQQKTPGRGAATPRRGLRSPSNQSRGAGPATRSMHSQG
jgi:hypothetical protein